MIPTFLNFNSFNNRSINNLEKLLQQNEKLFKMLKQFNVSVADSKDNNFPYFDSFPDMLKQLIGNASFNSLLVMQ